MAKKKNLFTHLKQITGWKNEDYWEDLTEEEKKSYSPYMINRFLSMEPDYIELVNEIQQYQLSPKENYDIYMELLPKQSKYFNYMKGSKSYDKKDSEVLAKHFNISKKEANYYIDVLSEMGEKKETIDNIKEKYGELYNE